MGRGHRAGHRGRAHARRLDGVHRQRPDLDGVAAHRRPDLGGRPGHGRDPRRGRDLPDPVGTGDHPPRPIGRRRRLGRSHVRHHRLVAARAHGRRRVGGVRPSGCRTRVPHLRAGIAGGRDVRRPARARPGPRRPRLGRGARLGASGRQPAPRARARRRPGRSRGRRGDPRPRCHRCCGLPAGSLRRRRDDGSGARRGSRRRAGARSARHGLCASAGRVVRRLPAGRGCGGGSAGDADAVRPGIGADRPPTVPAARRPAGSGAGVRVGAAGRRHPGRRAGGCPHCPHLPHGASVGAPGPGRRRRHCRRRTARPRVVAGIGGPRHGATGSPRAGAEHRRHPRGRARRRGRRAERSGPRIMASRSATRGPAQGCGSRARPACGRHRRARGRHRPARGRHRAGSRVRHTDDADEHPPITPTPQP